MSADRLLKSSSSSFQIIAPEPGLGSKLHPKKKRNLPGTPDPEAEVIALSPRSLMATNRFICEICNKGFQRDQNLQLHRRGHNLPWKLRQRTGKEPWKRVYVCPETSCVHHDPSRALGDLTGIKKHFSRKHGEKKWKCDRCSKKYAVHSDWKAHVKTCGSREYKCDCGTIFSRKDSFITHRAFCDALTEEGGKLLRLPSANSLHLLPPHSMLSPALEEQRKGKLPVATFDSPAVDIHIPDTTHGFLSPSSLLIDDEAALFNPPHCVGSPFQKDHGDNPASEVSAVLAFLSATEFSPRSHAPMAATSLLQKAAQIGAFNARVPSSFVGFPSSSSSSSPSEAPRNLLNETRRSDHASALMNRVCSLPPADPSMVTATDGLTRDFLGVGPDEGTSRSLLNIASLNMHPGDCINSCQWRI